MIRFLGLLIFLIVGLVLAVVWAGQMHHLRQFAPEYLPEWTKQIEDTAQIRQGRLVQPASAVLPELVVEWRAKLPGGDGWLWDVTVTGDGVAVQAELTVGFWSDSARLRGGLGTLDLAKVSKGVADGIVRVLTIDGEAQELLDDVVLTGSLSAEVRAISVQDVDLGQGPVAGDLSANGSWSLRAELAGGLSAAKAELSGTIPDGMAAFRATIAQPEALSPEIAGLGRQTEDGLVFELPVRLGN